MPVKESIMSNDSIKRDDVATEQEVKQEEQPVEPKAKGKNKKPKK